MKTRWGASRTCFASIVLLTLLLLVGSMPAVAQDQQDSPQRTRSVEALAAENVELVSQTGGAIKAVAVQGSYAYIGVGPHLVILNVSNPAQPTAVGRTGVLPDIVEGIAVSGNYAYIAGGYSGLHIFDISNPSSPTEVGVFDTPNYALGVAVAGNYAYVADGYKGLRIINVTNPAAPTEVGAYDTPAYAQQVAVAGNYAYIAEAQAWDGSQWVKSSLRIINVANPAAPTQAGFFDSFVGDAKGVAAAGSYAYVTDYLWGLRVINVTNPAAPTQAGYYLMGGYYPYGVAVVGNYAYVPAETSMAGWSNGLQIINISNPAAPTGAGFGNTPSGDPMNIAIAGNYAYVAGVRELSIRTLPINITNPWDKLEQTELL